MAEDQRQHAGTAADRAERKLSLIQKIISDVRIMLPTLVLLFGGTVYGNSETVKGFFQGEQLEPIEDISQPTTASMDEQQNRAINQLTEKLKRIEAQQKANRGESQHYDQKNFKNLQEQIDKIKTVVQP